LNEDLDDRLFLIKKINSVYSNLDNNNTSQDKLEQNDQNSNIAPLNTLDVSKTNNGGEIIMEFNVISSTNPDTNNISNSIYQSSSINEDNLGAANHSIKNYSSDSDLLPDLKLFSADLDIIESVYDISLVELTKSVYTRSLIVIRVVINLLADLR